MNCRIVYNRPDGGVTVRCPAPQIIKWMASGGWFDPSQPRTRTWQGEIEAQIEAGFDPDVTRKFIRALAFGGCTTAEALEIIRDRDVERGSTAIELWDVDELPDRWFRNAWRRSHNGGPIVIDIEKARPLQAAHIVRAVTKANKRSHPLLERFRKPPQAVSPDWDRLYLRINKAHDEPSLRAVWPEELR